MVASRFSGGGRGKIRSGRRVAYDTAKLLPVIRAAIGVLLLVAGCGKPASKGQSGEARDTTAIEGETTEKESRGGLGDMFKLPEPTDEDAEPSQKDDNSDSQ
jgi:hypothetical protein